MTQPEDIPPDVNPKLYAAALDFMREVNEVFAAFLDALAGIDRLRVDLIKFQEESIDKLKESDPENATEKFLDTQPIHQELASNDTDPAKELHRATQGEFKERTAPDGLDRRLLGQMTIVRFYALWEEKYREKFAIATGLSKKNDLHANLFGDLAKLRHAIIHNDGIATSQVEAAAELKWFKRNDPMIFSIVMVDVLFDKLDVFVTKLCNNAPTKPSDT